MNTDASACLEQAFYYPFAPMPALVIKSFPETLHAKLRQTAAAHRRSVTQETIHLLETALAAHPATPPDGKPVTPWAKRKLLPEYEALVRSGALTGGTDSGVAISEERDVR